MNTAMLTYGKAICLELGRAVAGQAPAQTALPPTEAATAFCTTHHVDALYAAAVSLRGKLPETYTPLVMRGKQRIANQLKIGLAEQALSHRFTAEGIRHIVLKGSHTSGFYPAALPRTSADIDWQVAPDDKDRAHDILIADGWSLVTDHDDERCYEKAPRLRLELHLAPEGFRQDQQTAMQAMFDRAVAADGLRFQLTDSDAYIYAVFHLYKHFLIAGAGVRMLLDVYTIGKYAALDQSHIERTLQALGCERFATRVREINAVLFDGADSNDDLDTLIGYVFAAGAYGVSEAQLALETINSPLTHRSRVQQAIRNYCLDAASMKTRYPCLHRAMWLYPFCAIHRLCHGLRHRRDAWQYSQELTKRSRAQREHLEHILKLASIL